MMFKSGELGGHGRTVRPRRSKWVLAKREVQWGRKRNYPRKWRRPTSRNFEFYLSAFQSAERHKIWHGNGLQCKPHSYQILFRSDISTPSFLQFLISFCTSKHYTSTKWPTRTSILQGSSPTDTRLLKWPLCYIVLGFSEVVDWRRLWNILEGPLYRMIRESQMT